MGISYPSTGRRVAWSDLFGRIESAPTQTDLALYRAKDEGRDQYCFHTDDLDREVRERVAIVNDLRHALERDELELYYQPQVELATGKFIGMEALIRWNQWRKLRSL